MFNQTTEYTLRVVVFLASLGGQSATARQAAAATRVPEKYLAKVLQTLSRAGLVKSQRGLGGGATLTREPAAITVLQVINAVSPLARITTCPLGLASHGTTLCPLHKRLDQAIESVETAFRETTIADLLAEPTDSIPLQDLPTDTAAATRAAEAVFQVSRLVTLGIPKK